MTLPYDPTQCFQHFLFLLQRSFAQPAVSETALCSEIEESLGHLLLQEGWLSEAHRQASPGRYQRHLLHEDAAGRFSIGSFVWAPGQFTPIHDHHAWGVVGCLRSGIEAVNFQKDATDQLIETSRGYLSPGQTTFVNAEIGDIHRVGNPSQELAITIHIYGTRFQEVCKTLYD